MTSRQFKDAHQSCIEIQEAIEHFERRIESTNDSINGFPGTFPYLRNKYTRKLEILAMCIARLEQRHQRILSNIIKSSTL